MELQLVSEYLTDEKLLPVRGTSMSAGYDLRCAKDTVVPSLWRLLKGTTVTTEDVVMDLENVPLMLKKLGIKPTLVPTGVRIKLPSNMYAGVHARSSLPLKHMLIVANDEGIIDADYYYADNEGHIHVMLLNLAPFDIKIKKYDKLAQLVIKNFQTVLNDQVETKKRTGGFGSTGN